MNLNLTEKQQHALVEFCHRISDVWKPYQDDRYLVDWLKARKFDLKKSEAMYRKSMAWREEMGADTILQDWEPPEIMKKYYPGGILGRDREGAVVVIDAFGRADLKGIMKSVKRLDIMKTMAYRVELSKRMKGPPGDEVMDLGDTPNKIVYIIDMTGFNTKMMADSIINLISEIVRMLEDNYPETLKKTFFINAPKIFVAAYDLVKRFLNKDTASKCKMLGTRWHNEVFKLVDPVQIPQFYGGERVDENGDPKCTSIIGYGGEVPQSCYQKMAESIPEGNASEQTTIGVKRTFSVPVTITTPNSFIQWMFATEKGEITFSIKKDNGSKGEVFVSPKKVDCAMIPEEGLVAAGFGKYILKFENPSMIHSKKLTYYVNIMEQETRADDDDDSSVADSDRENNNGGSQLSGIDSQSLGSLEASFSGEQSSVHEEDAGSAGAEGTDTVGHTEVNGEAEGTEKVIEEKAETAESSKSKISENQAQVNGDV